MLSASYLLPLLKNKCILAAGDARASSLIGSDGDDRTFVAWVATARLTANERLPASQSISQYREASRGVLRQCSLSSGSRVVCNAGRVSVLELLASDQLRFDASLVSDSHKAMATPSLGLELRGSRRPS